ncbi:MAG: hypothetical protein AAFO58_10805 [Pseudomonadota bacterium]
MAHDKRSCSRRPEPTDTALEDLSLDAADRAVLFAARVVFVQFTEPAQQAWMSLTLSANTLFRGPQPAETLRRVCAVVHEMMISRRSDFRFSNPKCDDCSRWVTVHERHLVQMIQAGRQNERSRAEISAMLLCEGHATDRVLAAVWHLADCLPEVEHRSVTPSLQE